MAKIVEVQCRTCGTASQQIDGPTSMGVRPRCDRCGTARFVSIRELVESDPPGIDPAGAAAWDLRFQRVTALAGRCECGGDFFEDAPIRCPGCSSTDVSADLVGFAD